MNVNIENIGQNEKNTSKKEKKRLRRKMRSMTCSPDT